ncbi:MAG: hypothetical protein WCG36_01005 [bacterium]
MNRFRIAGVAWVAGFGLATGLAASPSHDFGCLASSGEDLHGRNYVRAAGPLFEQTSRGRRTSFAAFRPFYSRESDDRIGREEIDLLWPVGHIRHWNNETDWRFLSAFYFGPRPTDPRDEYRFWLFPVMALGRNGAGEDYGAVFPLGGRIDNWFGRDRVEFALFPLYWHSELKDLRTDHWLWPFISRTTGDEIYRFRVFPFYGRSERKNEGESRFILWPFWTSSRTDRPGIRGSGFMLFPIYGHAKTEKEETWMFLPPFFRHTTGKSVTQNVYLWPFIQTEKTKGQDKFYVWPVYGRRTTADDDRRFWAWPFIWNRHETRAPDDIRRFRIFPLYCSESTRPKSAPTNVVDRYVSVWPVMSYERTRDGYKRVRVVDLWPFRDTAPIERNLSPLWTLYKYERTGLGRENEILWGAARWGALTNGTAYGSVFPLASWEHDRKDDRHRKWDFLKGMLGYRRDGAGKQWQLMYFLKWRTEP